MVKYCTNSMSSPLSPNLMGEVVMSNLVSPLLNFLSSVVHDIPAPSCTHRALSCVHIILLVTTMTFFYQQREGASLKFIPRLMITVFIVWNLSKIILPSPLSSAVHVERTREVQWDAKQGSPPFSHYWLLGNSLSNCIYGETGSNNSLELPAWNYIGNGKWREQENNKGSIKAGGMIGGRQNQNECVKRLAFFFYYCFKISRKKECTETNYLC